MEALDHKIEYLIAENKRLKSNERMLHAICATSPDAFLYFTFVNQKYEGLGKWFYFFNINPKKIKNDEFLYEEMDEHYREEAEKFLFPEKFDLEESVFEYYQKNKNKWTQCNVSVTYDEQKNPLEKVMRFRDITKLKQQNDELSYMVYYDPITGLFNRNYFVRNLNYWFERAKKEKKKISILFIDIDDFRKLNDGMGLLVGDEIVQQVGQYLNGFSNEYVMVSHFSSDIYCMSVFDPAGERSIEYIYENIMERMASPFLLTNGAELNISLSIGVAEYPEAGENALEVINNAEIVMSRAKSFGHGGMQYFDEPMLKEFLKIISMENKLKTAFGNGEESQFILYYQPQYDIRTKKLRGMEALIRWKDGKGGLISPGVFIPIAEKNGTIVPIGQWVLEEGISTFTKWKKRYNYDMVLSVNISAIQYKKEGFVSNLIGILKKYEMKPSELELEITESILIDDFEAIIRKMKKLREYGVRVSLDDFGTGYSSLSYLKGLPVDTLKIDKTFIDTVVSDKTTKIITHSIVSLVKQLGYETVAEGVETDEQMEYLREIECDNIQGFLLGKPMPQEEMEILLEALKG